MQPFRVLCADPPWPFEDSLGSKRGAANNYTLLSANEICRFPLPPLADDAVLFLWRVASQQQEALDVMRIWGFGCPKSEIVWLKKTVNGNRWFGMWRIVRAEHEICLIGRRGNYPVGNHSVRSTFVTEESQDFTGLSAVVRRHSEKPEEFYQIVESLYAGPFCELFARRQRPGWTCLGDEVGA